MASPKNCFNLALHPLPPHSIFKGLLLPGFFQRFWVFHQQRYLLPIRFLFHNFSSTYFFSLPKSSKIIYPNIGDARGTTTVETQKHFHEIIYTTSLNGRIYPSYTRKTQNLDRHITHSANNTDGYICQRTQIYLKKLQAIVCCLVKYPCLCLK